MDTRMQPTGRRRIPPGEQRQFFGHPIGLFILFFAEMWERFSYYGMRGLLKLYMVNYLFVTVRQSLQGQAYDSGGNPSATFGWDFIKQFLPAVASTKCVTEKIASLVQGDAANNIAGLTTEAAHAIATQTCGASSQASVLYGWYTGLVYVTPILGGLIADRWLGQRKTVVVGGLLMALGHFVMAIESSFFVALVLLILGNGAFKPNISTQVGRLYPPKDPRRDGAFTIFYMGINTGAFICNFVCGTLAVVYGWHYGFAAAGVGMLLGLSVYLWGQKYLADDNLTEAKVVQQDSGSLSKQEWARVGALVVLCALNIVFWAVYEQQGNTMQSWADDKTIWPTILGFHVPSTWFQSFNPFCIILLGPLLDMFWRWQTKRGTVPSTVSKMAIGSFLLGFSFIVMIIGVLAVGDGKGSAFWPLFCTLLLTVGELYLSPIGLSLVTKVSPARIVSMMMGMWFLSSFFGNTLSGYIGVLYDIWPKEYFFLLLMSLGVGTGLAMWAFNRPLRSALGEEGRPPGT